MAAAATSRKWPPATPEYLLSGGPRELVGQRRPIIGPESGASDFETAGIRERRVRVRVRVRASADAGMRKYESGRVEVAQRPRMRETVSAGVHRDDREALPHAAHARQFR